MSRKLASVQRIQEIKTIPNADAICAYRVGGWWVVDKIDAYKVGDLAIYCEIDSWIPHVLAPFLTPSGHSVRVFNGIPGARLRTVKLRGQISQGILFPLKSGAKEGEDLTEALGILKWEAPIPAQLASIAEEPYPSYIPKTDQERIQNLSVEFEDWVKRKLTWEVTEKLDGSSMTVFVNHPLNEEGVCSRNFRLRETEENTFWAVTRRQQLLEAIRSTGRSLAFQGELIGERIQKNPYSLKGQFFYLYDVFDIDKQQYVSPSDRRYLAAILNILHVPLWGISNIQYFDNVEHVLANAEGLSLLSHNRQREGLVFKCNEERLSFKAISNIYLLKEKAT